MNERVGQAPDVSPAAVRGTGHLRGRYGRVQIGITSERLDDGIGLVAVSGESDLYTAPHLKGELLRLIGAGATRVVVDLSRTSFVDSATLGVLLGGLKRLRPKGGEITLVVDDANIRKIFEITLLDRVFPIVQTLPEALERVGVAAHTA
jgi:anti-sigma B factor antagonist